MSVKTTALLALLTASGIVVGCASASKQVEPDRLYFALELRQGGRTVGTPKLLGEVGKPVKVERRTPGAAKADYELALVPVQDGDRYRIQLDVKVPGGEGHSELALLHGEERKLSLGREAGELEVTLLLMQVDSPEFRALMELSERDEKRAASSI